MSFIRWVYLTGCYLSLIEICVCSTCLQINLKFVSAALEEDRTNGIQILGIYQKKLVESPNPEREKLKSDYSLLDSSDLMVEFDLRCQLSTVNCQLSTVNC
ncbi:MULTISPECIES: hypothetical protein [unclassified Microcoleus]|uniref:hypothetical protein n=1 Tax=unclassified Microcoleus TaxID=2642155 RepID=UPI0025F66621|nr:MULTISPECIES: hypothetical protein [unclassified Microcoleus]